MSSLNKCFSRSAVALILTVIAGDRNIFQIIGLENPRITHISVSLVFSIVIATVTDKNTENDQVFAFLRWRFKPMYDFILGHLINIVPADLWRFFASSEHLIKSLVSQNLVLIFLLLGVTVARYHCQAVYFQIQAWYKSTFIAHTHIVSFSSYLIKCWLKQLTLQ